MEMNEADVGCRPITVREYKRHELDFSALAGEGNLELLEEEDEDDWDNFEWSDSEDDEDSSIEDEDDDDDVEIVEEQGGEEKPTGEITQESGKEVVDGQTGENQNDGNKEAGDGTVAATDTADAPAENKPKKRK